MAELTPDAPVVLRKWTMKELMDEWQTHLGAEGTRSRAHRPYAAGTIQRYKECMRLVVDGLPDGETTNPLEVDLLVMQKALRTVEGATRNRRITAVQSMAKWARREHKLVLPLTSDDYAELKDEEDEPTLDRAVTEDELAKVRAASSPEWSDLWLVLARTGLRVGEVQTMKRKNITTAGDQVFVSFTKAVKVEVTKRGKKKKVKRGKSKKAVRRVPVLDPEAAAVLLRLRRTAHSELTPVWPVPQRSYQLAPSTWERAMATVGLVHEEAVVAWKRALRSVKRRKASAYTPAGTPTVLPHSPRFSG